ncbi:putative regulator of phospholipase D SRF1 [Rosellinia necatrix]|uniref:Putative regulator of phospholipase D SRF1 n=1 Tax=Rosellinia necatrix TaxID=77044 RepID=A0A1W2TDZ4_ROSNE|nr:putative regulator of phospholipase D SRF1 [Rosellinia necatrix]
MAPHPLRATVPAWVELYDEEIHGPRLQGSVHPPPPSVRPEQSKGNHSLKRRVSKDGYVEWVDEKHGHVSKLPVFLRKRADRPGRRWDHLRTAEPVIMGLGYRAPDEDPYDRWRDFIHSSSYGQDVHDQYEVVDQAFLDQLMPGLDEPVRTPLYPLESRTTRSRKTAWFMRLGNFVLRHPIAPLIFRLIVLITTISALALATIIYRRERDPELVAGNNAETSQAIVAIVIDSVAIPYILYMTWDEYTGKPLGLRAPAQKISLILLDLVFIVLKSASTSLAFEALVYHSGDGKASNPGDSSQEVESLVLARGLAALTLVGLIAWILNFTISVFRLAEKLGGIENAPDK